MPRKTTCPTCHGAGFLTDGDPNDPNTKDLRCDHEGCDRGQVLDEGCGSCYAGIVVMNGNEIQRCDECGIFDTDDAAVDAAVEALEKLDEAYQQPEIGDVAGALAVLKVSLK